MRGWTASRFSFNTRGGRCEECEGQGIKKIEMSFLPDVKVACEACGGERFNAETLQLRNARQDGGRSAGDERRRSARVLRGARFDPSLPAPAAGCRAGYLTLGQQSPTPVRRRSAAHQLVYELSKTNALPTLYVLDEPTVGLHMADVEKLIRVTCTAWWTPATP